MKVAIVSRIHPPPSVVLPRINASSPPGLQSLFRINGQFLSVQHVQTGDAGNSRKPSMALRRAHAAGHLAQTASLGEPSRPRARLLPFADTFEPRG